MGKKIDIKKNKIYSAAADGGPCVRVCVRVHICVCVCIRVLLMCLQDVYKCIICNFFFYYYYYY